MSKVWTQASELRVSNVGCTLGLQFVPPMDWCGSAESYFPALWPKAVAKLFLRFQAHKF